MSHTGDLMNAKPRLLILSKYFSYGFGGTPEAVLLLARSLDRAGVAVDVRAHDRFISDAGKLGDLPPRKPPAGLQSEPRVIDYAGLIIAGAWIFRALPLTIAARRARIPIIYQTKGQLCRVEFARLRDLRRLLYLLLVEIWVALLATYIQFTSHLEEEASLLPGWLKRKKGFILPEPLDGDRLGRVSRPPRAPDAPLRLGFIAQISPRKGLREFIEGLLSWSEAHPGRHIDLTVAGTAAAASEAYLEGIKAQVATNPGDAKVRFLGQISGPDRMKFYAETDVIVVPSHFESFCLAVPEALWHGCVVLAAPRLGVLEFLKGCENIRMMRDLSPGAVAGALDGLTQGWDHVRASADTHRPIAQIAPSTVASGILSRIGGPGLAGGSRRP